MATTPTTARGWTSLLKFGHDSRCGLTPQKRRASVIGCLLFGTTCCYLGSERISKIPPDSVARRQSTRIIANSNGAGISSTKLPAGLLPTPLFSEHFIQLDHENDNDHVNATLPPLDTLVSRSISTNPAQIVKNVDFLLDFAIVGFANNQDDSSATTTTTTLPKLIRPPRHEPLWLRDQKPAKAVSVLYRYAQAEQKQRQERLLLPHQKALKGYKNPSDIQYAIYSPRIGPTPNSFVTVRHPVQWIASIYNYCYYMIEKSGRFHEKLIASDLLSAPRDGILACPIGSFSWKHDNWSESKNNTTRLQQFVQDLEDYLGLPRHYLDPRPLHTIRPYSQDITTNLDDYRMDICAPQWAPVLDEMTKIFTGGITLVATVLDQEPGCCRSSPEYLEQLLKDWMINPCDKNVPNNNDERQKKKCHSSQEEAAGEIPGSLIF
ncbi:hypothetical protein SEMRO_534_G161820.1 [Seminavis robusta]|uniref:Uncharacterized protein n=1 Tax=Seminavis robusta TaxID=568900 RepID=A0A9N8HJ44_9STRA|nr:hypothetical protein SEMRO_534_G161820.1 [Seminavis robusta]|eukprot:Sro534_g161820.1 n/a (435) ;mRNA; f:55891-57398